MYTLSDVKAGQTAVIKEISDSDIATQALRMGIFPGEIVFCLAKIPSGPTVICHSGMELAIGSMLSNQIKVELQ